MIRNIILATVLILVAISSANSATIYVPDDYPTIQDAIIAAVNGDTVIVRSGTYVENIDFIGKAIAVNSEMGSDVTIIDGNQAESVVTFKNGEGAGSVLDGFTVTNGAADNGGGIYCHSASPAITNNIITGNTADNKGGGIYCYSASPAITNNIITGNTTIASIGGGGGIYCHGSLSTPTIADNTITGNTGYYGGGIEDSHSSSTITNNIITGNTANKYAGGILCWYASSIITNNFITGNSALNGGGIYCQSSSSTITNNTISGNSAGGIYDGGGGIYCHSSSPAITNNTVTENSAGSKGGGIWCSDSSSPTITNTILWDNSAASGGEIWIGSTTNPSTLTISYSDVEGGQSSCHVDPGCTLNWGAGMIDADPFFADSGSDDHHLTWNSPCKDAGDNTAVTELYDFEGDPRIHDGTADMGADEFHAHLYHVGTVSPGSPIEVKVVGNPGIAPVTLALGSGVQDPPQSTPYGDLYLILPFAQTFNLGGVPTNGVLVLSTNVPSSWQSGDEYFFQALVGPQAPGSVLTNLLCLQVQ
jgi:parallel beta-helix repeat protein